MKINWSDSEDKELFKRVKQMYGLNPIERKKEMDKLALELKADIIELEKRFDFLMALERA